MTHEESESPMNPRDVIAKSRPLEGTARGEAGGLAAMH